MIERIVVFDLELLNSDPSSICSIGIVELVNKKINSTYYTLVKPYNLSFDPYAYNVHKINKKDLFDQRMLKDIWPEIRYYFENSIVVSHDIQGDLRHLREALQQSHIEYPDCIMSCTNVMSHLLYPDIPKYNLTDLAAQFNYTFEAHHALSDAKATAFILLKMLEEAGCDSLYEFHKMYGLEFGEMHHNYYRNIISPELVKVLCKENINKHYFTYKQISVVGRIHLEKDELEEKIKSVNGYYVNHISTQTNYVIIGKTNPKRDQKKLEKIRQLQSQGQDIELLSEEDFLHKLSLKKSAVNQIHYFSERRS